MNWVAYDAVIGTTLAAEVERLVVFAAFVDHAVREHGLVGDAEDEDAEGEVLRWLGVAPHIYSDVRLEVLGDGTIRVIRVTYLPWMLQFSPSTSGSLGIRR